MNDENRATPQPAPRTRSIRPSGSAGAALPRQATCPSGRTSASAASYTAALFREAFAARGRSLSRQALERGKFRGELPPHFDIEVAIDVMSGAIWYRLLLGHAPLDDAYADGILRIVLDGIRPSREVVAKPARAAVPRARRG